MRTSSDGSWYFWCSTQSSGMGCSGRDELQAEGRAGSNGDRAMYARSAHAKLPAQAWSQCHSAIISKLHSSRHASSTRAVLSTAPLVPCAPSHCLNSRSLAQAAVSREELGAPLAAGGHLARHRLQRLHHLRRLGSGTRMSGVVMLFMRCHIHVCSRSASAETAAAEAQLRPNQPTALTPRLKHSAPPTCARWSSSSFHCPGRASGWKLRGT